jgi:CRISPR-associated endonuclease/helicase Cas3
MNPIPAFTTCFNAITGHNPLRWQTRFFERMRAGTIPSACDLPTGLGKTSVIPIWLIALACQDSGSGIQPLPRRLVYVVNRRTVVDQASDIVEKMRERLQNPSDDRWAAHNETLTALARRLRALSVSGDGDDLLGVSTLRGELADNEEWKADPARPAIIIGTIDMIGSKLLFRGYGDGPYHRAHHTGLIGQDVLIVHDEAHLTPAFSDLLRGVADVQRKAHEPRPAAVVELSATQRKGDDDDVLGLEPGDEGDKIVKDRLDATKHLRLHDAEKNDAITKLVELGKQHDKTPSKVLIYVRSPEDAQKVAALLKQALERGAEDHVALLTGTIRGHERDRLVNENPVYRALLDHKSQVKRTVYLVSTSAGEVGIDLDADHMVCDLTTLDAMVQRLGRVNRLGGKRRRARVDVVAGQKNPPKKKGTPSGLELAIQATYSILKDWAHKSKGVVDVCPRNLRDLLAKVSHDERIRAFSPKGDTRDLTDILLDAWSLTSIDQMPGRPGVAAYLHGLTHDPPETYVVWRKEVIRLDKARVDPEVLRDWFSACRIEARERLRDSTERVKKVLADLLKAHREQKEDKQRDFRVVLLDERGRAEWWDLSKITEKGLDYLTVVLPAEAGGLNEHGMLDSKALEPIADIDVAERVGDDRRERWLRVEAPEGEECERLLTGDRAATLPQGLREQERIVLKQQPEGLEDEGETLELVLMVSPRKSALENPETARVRQTLTEHTNLIGEHIQRMVERLRLERPIQDALVTAARWHDHGKDRPVWQRYACNQGGAKPLARSAKYLHPRALGGYRHEFGSLLEAESCEELSTHPERDLVLHLIGAHHGWARPHCETRAFDRGKFTTAKNEETAAGIMRRFGRLQQRFGRWGLAWLESLLRCADIAASKAAADEAVPVPKQQETTA